MSYACQNLPGAWWDYSISAYKLKVTIHVVPSDHARALRGQCGGWVNGWMGKWVDGWMGNVGQMPLTRLLGFH